MKIKLKIISYLIYHSGFSEKELALNQSITVKELLPKINLKKQFPMLIIRNGKKIDPNDKIQDGDRIVIAPFFLEVKSEKIFYKRREKMHFYEFELEKAAKVLTDELFKLKPDETF